MISENEYNKRLDANGAYLRTKIKLVGDNVLWGLIVGKKSPNYRRFKGGHTLAHERQAGFRFMVDIWVDKNGDVVPQDSRKHFYSFWGIPHTP